MKEEQDVVKRRIASCQTSSPLVIETLGIEPRRHLGSSYVGNEWIVGSGRRVTGARQAAGTAGGVSCRGCQATASGQPTCAREMGEAGSCRAEPKPAADGFDLIPTLDSTAAVH